MDIFRTNESFFGDILTSVKIYVFSYSYGYNSDLVIKSLLSLLYYECNELKRI